MARTAMLRTSDGGNARGLRLRLWALTAGRFTVS